MSINDIHSLWRIARISCTFSAQNPSGARVLGRRVPLHPLVGSRAQLEPAVKAGSRNGCLDGRRNCATRSRYHRVDSIQFFLEDFVGRSVPQDFPWQAVAPYLYVRYLF